MNLIIVESPTKSKTLQRFLGKEYKVEATMGHVRDLPKSTLGVDIKHDFKPEYVDVVKRADVVAKIKQDAKGAKQIFLATDPDREGEAIAWHVEGLLKNGKSSKINRIVFHEITEEAVKQAIATPRKIDMPLVHAQQARRVLDRLVGYKLSPLLWKKVRRGLSAGRVQSVTVRLIVEREREIEAFKTEEYWEVYCLLKAKTKEFIVQLIKVGGKSAEVKNKKQADRIVAGLKKADYQIAAVVKKETHRSSLPPFTTSTMAQRANNSFGWSARRTMSVAQKLYEEGLITYHRTDSLSLSAGAVDKARGFIKKEYGLSYVPEKPRFFKTKSKSAQEAHEAIRPTNAGLLGSQIDGVDNYGRKLYEIIWRRFIACQMVEAVFDLTTIDVEAGDALLRAQGRIMKFDGWMRVYGPVGEAEQEQVLPEVVQGQGLSLIKVDPQQKFTQAAARYNEASLVKTLEKLGIGRPSTYAPTIYTIQTRQYVEKEEGRFKPTPVGVAVNDFLFKHFPSILDYDFTAEMEGELDKIAEGKRQWVPVIKAFWSPFNKKLKKTETAKRVEVETEKTGKKCPKCNIGEEVIRVGRFGKFLSCSRFPECDYTAHFVEKVGMKCPDCKKGDIIVRKTRKGRRFFGCSRYPDCKFASWKNPKISKPATT